MTSETITNVFSEALELAVPDLALTVSQWAERYRRVAAERSARPGPWSNELLPYLIDIMDAASTPDVRHIVLVKPNQVGGTESICNMIGYFMHADPTTQLYAAEDEKKVDAWSKESLAPMIRESPALHALVRETRMRDSGNTIKAKSYPGGHLAIGWATSPATATSRPRRIVYLDERDSYLPTAAGDYCTIAALRTDTYTWDSLIVKASTPRDRLENPPGTPLDAPRFSPIEREYQASDQREFWVPCPHCDEYQRLKWSNIKWDKEPTLHAYYMCEHCAAVIEEEDKSEMLALGEWRAAKPFRGVAGFWINKLYSPLVPWVKIVSEFLTAKNSGDPNLLKVWVNNSLAEGWEPPEEKIETSEIQDRCEDYGGDDGFVPVGVCLPVAGVDVHPDRLEAEIVGWGLNLESWSLDYVVVHGDPTKASTWEELKTKVINREFTRADGVVLKVVCTAIDSGGGFTNEVYAFAHANRGYRVFAIKGASTAGRPIVGKPTEAGKPKINMFLIGTEAAKDTFITNLSLTQKGPGYCHFPTSRTGEQGRVFYGEDHFKQLLSERPVMRKGIRVWTKIREAARNEALDCRVYAMAAYHILNPNMKTLHARLLREARTAEPPATPPDTTPNDGSDDGGPAQPPPTSGAKRFRIPRRRGGFVNNWR